MSASRPAPTTGCSTSLPRIPARPSSRRRGLCCRSLSRGHRNNRPQGAAASRSVAHRFDHSFQHRSLSQTYLEISRNEFQGRIVERENEVPVTGKQLWHVVRVNPVSFFQGSIARRIDYFERAIWSQTKFI
ncbi:hypothetical protein MPLA_250049 [Mesorhizobium sp. ORS 3359]|nr:hypothetical protein MPLA_250049 [Mesorhizobium sp. ORS 3359]